MKHFVKLKIGWIKIYIYIQFIYITTVLIFG